MQGQLLVAAHQAPLVGDLGRRLKLGQLQIAQPEPAFLVPLARPIALLSLKCQQLQGPQSPWHLTCCMHQPVLTCVPALQICCHWCCNVQLCLFLPALLPCADFAVRFSAEKVSSLQRPLSLSLGMAVCLLSASTCVLHPVAPQELSTIPCCCGVESFVKSSNVLI